MSLDEIATLMRAATRKLKRDQERREADMKQQIIMQRNHAIMVGEIVGNIFSKQRHELTPLHEFYPGLFKPEETVREMDLETYTELWEDYAYRYNERRRKQRQGGGAVELKRDHTEEVASGVDGKFSATPDGDEPGTNSNENGNG